MNIGLRSIFVPQARFVATAAISLVSRVLLVFGTEEDLVPLGVLEVVVDFAVRLLRGKRSTQVVLEISLQHPMVVIFASNQVIFIVLVHGNQGKTRAGFVLSVIPLISVPFIRWLRRNLRRVLWHPLSVRPEAACSLQESFSIKLHLQSGTVNGVRCSVLRDTGSTVCGVRKRLVRPCQLLAPRSGVSLLVVVRRSFLLRRCLSSPHTSAEK